MRFFLDSALLDDAKKVRDWGLLDGVWLSPAAAETAGVDYRRVAREMSALTDGPVCVGPTSTDAKGMYKEARELAKLGKDIVIQLPIEANGLRVARLLAQDQVAVCASGCYSAAQALIAAKANVAYVAPAVGPLDDVGSIGMDLVEQIIRIYDIVFDYENLLGTDRFYRTLRYLRLDPGMSPQEMIDVSEQIVVRNEHLRGAAGDPAQSAK